MAGIASTSCFRESLIQRQSVEGPSRIGSHRRLASPFPSGKVFKEQKFLWKRRTLFESKGRMISLVKAEECMDFAIEPAGKGKDRFSFREQLYRLRKVLIPTDIEGLGEELVAVALPAVLSQAIEPLAQLMDTAYIGRLGAIDLAAVAISVSIFNLVSKVFNIPLVNMTTSFVAADDAASVLEMEVLDEQSSSAGGNEVSDQQYQLQTLSRKRVIPAVSSALLLALVLAALESALLITGGGLALSLMGAPVNSPMRYPAVEYLRIRTLGVPAMVFSLAIQGIFRGFKDTKTPLYAIGLGNTCNVLLSPTLMFLLGYGLSGAAVATVSSQYLMALLLLWKLRKQVILIPSKLELSRFAQFLKSGGLLLGRTMAILITSTLAASMVARQGAASMAGHQILTQIWLATSMLSDALALAGQALMATAFANHNFDRVKHVAFGVLQISLSFGLFMALLLMVSLPSVLKIFTDDPAVLGVLAKGIVFVAATQPLNTLAFVFDGIHYGVEDFAYAAYSMIVVGILSCLTLLLAPRYMGLPGVWLGLTTLMGLRVVAGFIRLCGATGPWQFLKQT